MSNNMPMYETIAVAEKHSVILDIGTAYTKIGFAREAAPRYIIPSEINHPQSGKLVKIWDYEKDKELSRILKAFLLKIYFRHLCINPKDRRVVIVESVLCPTVFRNTLADVLFMHYEVPALVFVPSHLMALFTLGISSALVMDVGYNETSVLPIFACVPILSSFESHPVGGRLIHKRIKEELEKKAVIKGETLEETRLTDPLEESIVEDIKVRTCFVTPRSRGLILQAHENRKKTKGGTASPDPGLEVLNPPPDVSYPISSDKVITVPGTLREWAAEILFEPDDDDKSIATLILDSLLRCPIDTRKELANNVILMGGTAMLPGFKHSLLTEVKMLFDDPKYSSRLPLKEIKFHSPPAKENYVAWLGASAFGATEAVPSRCITKDKYRQNKYIPDWCDKKWAEDSTKAA